MFSWGTRRSGGVGGGLRGLCDVIGSLGCGGQGSSSLELRHLLHTHVNYWFFVESFGFC